MRFRLRCGARARDAAVAQRDGAAGLISGFIGVYQRMRAGNTGNMVDGVLSCRMRGPTKFESTSLSAPGV